MGRNFTTVLCLLFFTTVLNFKAQVIFKDPSKNLDLYKSQIYFLEDYSDTLKYLNVIKSNKFQLLPGSGMVPNFGITTSSFWIKLNIRNETDFYPLILKLNQATIDYVEFYETDHYSNKVNLKIIGEQQSFFIRDYFTPEYLFDLHIPKAKTKTVYLKLKCKENTQVPLVIGTRISFFNTATLSNLASGIYIGIMFVMILYNLFVYTTVRDKSYIIYSLYIILVLLVQTNEQGYTFQFIWPNFPSMAVYGQFIFPVAVGIMGLEFFKQFLRLKERFKKAYTISFVFLLPYALSLVLCFTGMFSIAFQLIEISAGLVSLFMLTVAFVIYRRGYSEARFFLIGWSIFLLGICIFVMKDFEVLPYNSFTRYTMHFGSAAEVILLSFALADKINILKREKEESQAEALEVSKQNQKLITEQNIVLEQKVHERTNELEMANEELTATLNQLKDAQIQLVDAEKMASLGQLTAGIAHEINNPINFVIANINPLRMDVSELLELIKKYDMLRPGEPGVEVHKEIEAYKQKIDLAYMKIEIDKILAGIDDGARRTAEIVAGLKNFSRLDESDVKVASINDGIESTLILLRSTVPSDVQIVKNLALVPLVECYPGKLNQVFMNLFTNALYALNKRTNGGEKKLIISTFERDEKLIVVIEDTGVGMSREVKDKVFEPFFTTKDVGEGTGLGMSIVFKIIETHQAKIEIESTPDIGTKITLQLNKKIMK